MCIDFTFSYQFKFRKQGYHKHPLGVFNLLLPATNNKVHTVSYKPRSVEHCISGSGMVL